MHLLAEGLSTGSMVFLVLAVGLALSFEFVNGFHDTANAVATVIYTHTLKPWVAVVWSGMWNLIGVLFMTWIIDLIWTSHTGSGGLAFTILGLLPVELVVNAGSSQGFAMVFALLISAIIWNLGTWYLGLPASSSHTLIGSIMGVGLANSIMQSGHTFGDGVNWHEVRKVFMSLLVSPLVGFLCAGGLLLLLKTFVKRVELFKAPPKDRPPPRWIRALLVLTCTGVSFGHGSNDGQKGMGLILLILIGILPASYALKLGANSAEVHRLQSAAQSAQVTFVSNSKPGVTLPADPSAPLTDFIKTTGSFNDSIYPALAAVNQKILATVGGKSSLEQVPADDRKNLRTDIYLVSGAIGKLSSNKLIPDDSPLAGYRKNLNGVTQFIPLWVIFAVACSLGLGTMIGWKRIVTTVGEKIGKDHLTYAQGASAELVAASTIILADHFNLPVSTTHVLSSGVAGTMAANGSGLQAATLRNIMLAWVLTLPVCVILGAGTFSAGLYIVFHNLTLPAAGVLGLVILLVLWRIWVVKNRPKIDSAPVTAPMTE